MTTWAEVHTPRAPLEAQDLPCFSCHSYELYREGSRTAFPHEAHQDYLESTPMDSCHACHAFEDHARPVMAEIAECADCHD